MPGAIKRGGLSRRKFVALAGAAVAGAPFLNLGNYRLFADSPAVYSERAIALVNIGIVLGVQNSEHFRSTDDIKRYYYVGQRVSQLTYNTQNLIASGSTDRADGGISDFGATVVAAMNEIGMAVDVSHCGDRTTLDAFALSTKPVLITHSNCRALAPGHPLQVGRGDRENGRQGRRHGRHRVAQFRHARGADHGRALHRPHRPHRETGRHRTRRHRHRCGSGRLR
jgi:hypothetical protein